MCGGSSIVLNNRNDQIGVEGSKPETLADRDEAQASLGANDRSPISFDRLCYASRKNPPRIIWREVRGTAILLFYASRRNSERPL